MSASTLTIDGVEYVRADTITAETLRASTVVRTIVRTRDAGVFFAEVTEVDFASGVATLKDARRLWYWDGAASLSQLAVDGTSKPTKCKFPTPVPLIVVTGVIEVMTVTEKAANSIDSVPVWEA